VFLFGYLKEFSSPRGCGRVRNRSRLKPVFRRWLMAALKRCATQKQIYSRPLEVRSKICESKLDAATCGGVDQPFQHHVNQAEKDCAEECGGESVDDKTRNKR
jgi:hypothetical protein